MALLSRLARISLLWKFALVNLIPILLLGLVLQHYLHSRVSERAIDDATKQALSISRSEVERFLSEHDLKYGLTKPEMLAIDETLNRPENQEHVQGITVWNRSLKVVYSPRRGEINRRVPLSNDVRLALSGRVLAHRSGSNLAVYVPLWLESLRQPAGGRRDLGRLLANRGRRPRPDEELLAPHPPRARSALRRSLPDRRGGVEGA